MKVKQLTVKDYGPFLGKHIIELDKGVNIVFGGNGYGKSLLFNALRFGIYGESLVPMSNEIINRAALEQGRKQASIKIDFELLGTKYTVERTVSANGNISSRLAKPKNQGLDSIYKKIPPDNANFFLLDGEEVREWVMALGRERKTTISILGLSIYEDVLSDLNRASADLKKRIPKIEREAGIQKLRSRLGTLSSEVKQMESSIQDLSKQFGKLDRQFEVLRDLTRLAREQQELTKKKTKLEQGRKQDKKKIGSSRKRIRILVQMLPYALIESDLHQAIEFVEHMKSLSMDARLKQGRLDAQTELLEAIAQGEECICGTPLSQSQYGKRSIRSLTTEMQEDIIRFEKAAKAEYWPSLAIMDMASKSDVASVKAEDIPKHLTSLKETERDMDKKREQIGELKKEISKLDKKIRSLAKKASLPTRASKDPVKLGQEAETIIKKRESGRGSLQAYQNMIKEKKKEIKSIISSINNKSDKEKERIQKIRKGIERLGEAADAVEEGLKSSVSKVLKKLEKEVNRVFGDITNKPEEFVSIQFSSIDGTPYIITRDDKALSMNQVSDGERQIVMLSLMSALRALSPAEAIIIDSPFGRLDAKHLESIVNILPSMAQQSLLFMTDREYRELARSDLELTTHRLLRTGQGSNIEVVP